MGVSSRIRTPVVPPHPMSGSCRCSAIANRFRCADRVHRELSVFSPDGRWIAYTTNEAGQPNVYVQPFPGPGAKYQVSRDGGSQPVWRADGKELFYLGADGTLMAVPIDATDRLRHRSTALPSVGPDALVPTFVPSLNTSRTYAVTRDGQRFLAIARPRQARGGAADSRSSTGPLGFRSSDGADARQPVRTLPRSLRARRRRDGRGLPRARHDARAATWR